MTETTCQICHKNAPSDGFQVCDTCKGFDPLAPRIEIDPTAKPIGHCLTCGADGWEPYKIGNTTIKAGICYSCVMRKKYGPDWVPGGNRKEVQARARAKRAAKKAENGTKQNTPAEVGFTYPPIPEPVLVDGDPVVRLAFDTRDQEMYRKIQAIATKERRTLEQQVLYLLDGVLGRTVV